MQRLNVTNTNGVHFRKVSGNQELLALNCGEHKPQTLTAHKKATAGEAKGASSITTWQATEKQPSSTDKTEQQS